MRPASARPPRLLAIDLDGTLLDRAGTPHARDLEAVRALRSRGVPVTILTGRLYSGTRASAARLGLLGPVACADGSHLVRASDHATLAHHAIHGAAAHVVRDSLQRHGNAVFLFAGDAIVHDQLGDPFLGFVRVWSQDVRRTERVCDHPAWDSDDQLTVVVATGTTEQIAASHAEISAQAGAALQVASFPIRRVPGLWGLVARAAGTTKGSALVWIARHHGCQPDETVCVGDWLNDVPMLRAAGRAFAMGHAPDEVKQHATDVLDETVETGGGVARAIALTFGS